MRILAIDTGSDLCDIGRTAWQLALLFLPLLQLLLLQQAVKCQCLGIYLCGKQGGSIIPGFRSNI